MIFRQMFEPVSCTYTYLLGSESGGEALIIDPVADKLERYLRLLDELGLTLVKAVDTHVHADHVTGLGLLRDATRCVTVMGKAAAVDKVSIRVDDGDVIEAGPIRLDVLYTPGHTDCSYCFRMPDRVFTGDTLLIRGTGRTDFQNGDARAAWRSITGKLLTLPPETLVYPGHDYKGDTVSTIAEESAHNPRLQVADADAYAEIMDGLDLPNPKQMDTAVPANVAIGLDDDDPEIQARTVAAADALELAGGAGTLFVDLRERAERARDGVIPGSVHVPYQSLAETIRPGGLLAAVAAKPDQRVLLYCAFGERSALALAQMLDAGLDDATHLAGGLDAWLKAGGAVEYPGA